MAAITDLSDLVNLATNGGAVPPQNIFWHKDARVGAGAAAATVAGRLTSLWLYNGSPSGGAVPPTSATVPTNATDGSLKQADPTGGRQLWMTGTVGCANVGGTLILYDRLLHISGLSGTVTTAQTVSGTAGRYTGTDAAGSVIWIEIYTAIGGTATTITASYTDQDGNAGQTSQAAAIGGVGLQEAQRIIPLTLAAGDTGVRAVASVDLVASTGTAGNFGVTIARPFAYIVLPVANNGQIRDFIAGLPAILEAKVDACFAFAWLANTTTAPVLFGSTHFVEK